jgi:hypothetical protein
MAKQGLTSGPRARSLYPPPTRTVTNDAHGPATARWRGNRPMHTHGRRLRPTPRGTGTEGDPRMGTYPGPVGGGGSILAVAALVSGVGRALTRAVLTPLLVKHSQAPVCTAGWVAGAVRCG